MWHGFLNSSAQFQGMKRADQHPVVTNKMHEHDAGIEEQEKTGLDVPAEKELNSPEQEDKPTMGALPIDVPGSLKHDSEWKSVAGDDTHEAPVDSSKAEGNAKDRIIATGTGPDPEHADNES